MRRLLALAAAAFALSGCDLIVDPNSGDEARDWRVARQRWAAAEPRGYEYTLEPQCFCAARTLVITVRDGRAVEARDASTGERVITTPGFGFRTVDDLLDEIGDALRTADDVRATYDRRYGFPTHVFIDYDRQTADDEGGYDLYDFRVLY